MSIGRAIRSFMPPALERAAANVYRALFVDLDVVADKLAAALPRGANVLDIGGGDGELLNRLFALRDDITVTMVDVAGSVGRFVELQFRDRTRFIPSTTIESHLLTLTEKYDAAIVVDVMHHVPQGERKGFLRAVGAALKPGSPLLVKDVEPGHFRAALGLFCDKYISGDRGVVLVSSAEMIALAEQLLGGKAAEAGLLAIDRPNYLISMQLSGDIA
jgi:cyclopropane fatty-acyl-phospholipid synthase-like methyltransferase